jgi:hypothetical protein
MDERERRELGLLALDAAVRGFGRGLQAVHVRSVDCTPDPHIVADVRLRPSAMQVRLTIDARPIDR